MGCIVSLLLWWMWPTNCWGLVDLLCCIDLVFVCCEILWYLSTGLFQPELGGMQSKSCLINSNPIFLFYQTFNLRWRMAKTNTISSQRFYKFKYPCKWNQTSSATINRSSRYIWWPIVISKPITFGTRTDNGEDGNPYDQQTVEINLLTLCWLAQTLLSGSEQMHWIRKWKWSISLEYANFQFPSPNCIALNVPHSAMRWGGTNAGNIFHSWDQVKHWGKIYKNEILPRSRSTRVEKRSWELGSARSWPISNELGPTRENLEVWSLSCGSSLWQTRQSKPAKIFINWSP